MSDQNQVEILRESLRMLVRRLGILERGEASCCDITLSQCHTIIEIGRAEKISLNALAEILGLEKSTVSRSIEKLVNDGIVIRETDQEDRRFVILKLTKVGLSLFAEIEKRMAVYFTEVIAGLPGDKFGQIIESLRYLANALKGPGCC